MTDCDAEIEIAMPTEDLTEEELYELLRAYRRQRARRQLIGPAISFVVHVLGLLLLSFLIVPKAQPRSQVVEIMTQELEIKEPPKEIEQEIEAELQELSEQVEQAPATPTPDLAAPPMELAMEDASDEAPETEDMDVPDMQAVLDIKVNVTPWPWSRLDSAGWRSPTTTFAESSVS